MAFHGSVPQYHLEEKLIESHHTFDGSSLPALTCFTCDTQTTMSRQSFSNQSELITIIKRCRVHAEEKSARALIVINMTPENWLQQFAQDIELPFIEASNATDRADRITSLLGTEQTQLIHQLAQRFDAGLFAAITGTIKAGGALIIGLPPGSGGHLYKRFHKILSVLSRRHSDTVLTAHYVPPHAQPRVKQSIIPLEQLERLAKPATSRITHAAKQEQDQLFEIACDYFNQHRRACILITGRRGRGKSMLMARLANWLDDKQLRYSLTAASQSGVSTIYQHCPSAKRAFVSADNASSAITDRLLVDEAGSLSLATLKRLLGTYEQVVFSTTVEGYENAGRAFDIRFAPKIRASYSHVLDLHPSEPWRWTKFDPLEQLVDQLLLTDQASLTNELTYPTRGATDSICTASTNSNSTCKEQSSASMAATTAAGRSLPVTHSTPRQIEQAELADDELKLLKLFTLLRDTHYQTTTQDLEHLLDSPDIQIWVIEKGQEIIATALLTLEGEIDSTLHEAIVSKKRRLPHQLLPQLLAQTANAHEALNARYARVIRISVAQSMRRTGVASNLIRYIETHLSDEQDGVSAMGASFASDSASTAFWVANDYTEYHRGFKRNPRTGKQAVAMIKALESTVDEIIDRAVQIHSDNCLVRRQLEYSPTSPTASAAFDSVHNAAMEPINYDNALLQRFAANQRSLNDTLGSLDRIAKRHGFSLHNVPENRKHYETSLRESIATLLLADGS